MRVLEKSEGRRSLSRARTAIGLSMLLHERGDYAEAAAMRGEARQTLESAYGADHYMLAWALLGLATVNRERRRYDVAVPLYDRSLALMEKTFSREHPNVALAVHGRAVLEYEQHRYRDAEDLERRAIAIQERVLGPTHPISGAPRIGHGESRTAAVRRRRAAVRPLAGADGEDVQSRTPECRARRARACRSRIRAAPVS